MGVRFHAAGLDYKDGYDCGYATFANYRCELAKAVSPGVGDIYTAWMSSSPGYTGEDGVPHDDGCTLSLEFPEYDVQVIPRMRGASGRDERRSAREFSSRMLAEHCQRLGEDYPVSGFSLETGVPGLVPTKIRCHAKYADLDTLFSKSFGTATAGFLFMPDTEGKLSWKECRDLYLELSAVKVDAQGHNYGECKTVKAPSGKPIADVRSYNMHEQFLGMFKHCWKRHVNLWWD